MKNDQMKSVLIVSLIIGASILGYGYMNNKYKTETLEKRGGKYEKCVKEAEDNLTTVWNKHCKSLGESDKCGLPSSVAKEYYDRKQKTINNCIRLYSINK